MQPQRFAITSGTPMTIDRTAASAKPLLYDRFLTAQNQDEKHPSAVPRLGCLIHELHQDAPMDRQASR